MDIVVKRHARKRIKQRVHKNWQQVAEDAWKYGLSQDELKGRLRKHIDWLALEKFKYGSKVSAYRVFNENVYLFGGHVLITVLHLPTRFVSLARRLTQQKMQEKMQ